MWLDAEGRPGATAGAARRLLDAAGDDGLDPRDYRVPPPRHDPLRFDVELSAAVLRYLDHLQSGRVSPRAAG